MLMLVWSFTLHSCSLYALATNPIITATMIFLCHFFRHKISFSYTITLIKIFVVLRFKF